MEFESQNDPAVVGTGGARGKRFPNSARSGFARAKAFLRAESEATGLPLGTLLTVAVTIHVIVLFLAVNPWHLDEHFQILEFAWARAGLAPTAALPWEFAAQIRPASQPMLAMGLLKALRALGVTSPFPWMLCLRLGTLAASLGVVLWVIARISPKLDRRGRQVLWLTGPFLWFAPLFMFRFTSENLAGLALVAALPLLEARTRNRTSEWWVGGLLGLSFVFRFQMAFSIVALLLWVTIYRPRGLRDAARIGAVAAIVVGASSLVDAWFYGEWVFTPWLYVRANLLEGMASSFGTSPVYSYFIGAPLLMAPPLSLVLLVLVGAGLAFHRQSVWTWAFAAFLVGHMLIPHKEVRFLLPLLYLVPVLAARGAEILAGRGPLKGWRRAVMWSVALQNITLALVLATPTPHRNAGHDAHYMRWLWDVADRQQGKIIYVLLDGGNPYLREPLEANVYRHPRVRGIAHEPGSPIPREVPPGTPPDRLLLLTRGSTSSSVAGADVDLSYVAEPGYTVMARLIGLDDTWPIRWLEDVAGWTGSTETRRVYQVSRQESQPGGPIHISSTHLSTETGQLHRYFGPYPTPS